MMMTSTGISSSYHIFLADAEALNLAENIFYYSSTQLRKAA